MRQHAMPARHPTHCLPASVRSHHLHHSMRTEGHERTHESTHDSYNPYDAAHHNRAQLQQKYEMQLQAAHGLGGASGGVSTSNNFAEMNMHSSASAKASAGLGDGFTNQSEESGVDHWSDPVLANIMSRHQSSVNVGYRQTTSAGGAPASSGGAATGRSMGLFQKHHNSHPMVKMRDSQALGAKKQRVRDLKQQQRMQIRVQMQRPGLGLGGGQTRGSEAGDRWGGREAKLGVAIHMPLSASLPSLATKQKRR